MEELFQIVEPFLNIPTEMQNSGASSEAPALPPESLEGTAQAKQGEGSSLSVQNQNEEERLKEELDWLRRSNRYHLQRNGRLLDKVLEGIEQLEAERERLKAEAALKDEITRLHREQMRDME